jgi:hypothetical protein
MIRSMQVHNTIKSIYLSIENLSVYLSLLFLMRSAFRDLKLSLARRTLREQLHNHYLEILFVHTRRHESILKTIDSNKLELADNR